VRGEEVRSKGQEIGEKDYEARCGNGCEAEEEQSGEGWTARVASSRGDGSKVEEKQSSQGRTESFAPRGSGRLKVEYGKGLAGSEGPLGR